MTCLRRILASTAIMLTSIGAAAPARAGGGLSSAWVQSNTDHSVNIRWGDPVSPEYQYCDNQTLTVCYKKDDVKGSCENHGHTVSFKVNPQRMVTIDNLSPSTKYEFTLEAQVAKQGRNTYQGRNGYKNCKFRKLASFTMTTAATYSPTLVDYIVISGAYKNVLYPLVFTNHNWDYDVVRVAYKLWGSSYKLTTASVRNGPANTWGTRNTERGWIDMSPSSVMEPTLDSLETCRNYVMTAYGFRPGSQVGEPFGTAMGKTSGTCSPSGFSGAFIDDHEGVLEAYAGAVHQFYCGSASSLLPCDSLSIFSHVAAQYPQLWADYQAMIEDGDWIDSEFETIQYLEHVHHDIFDEWQSEPALVGAGMDMFQFAEREYPSVYASLIRDTTDKPIIEPVPTAFPNPFNPETTIAFSVRVRGTVSLLIYDVEGRLIRTLVDDTLAEGPHTKVWDGRDNLNQPVPSGVYFYRLVAKDVVQTNKIVLLK